MDNKTIIGYDILAKRAIETESGINIDDALNRITAFRVVRGEGEDHHPSSDVTVSTKILYYTKTDKGYIAWIWVDGEGWVSAGGVSNESWKAWSEEHGSSAANEDSVYIGENLTAEGDFPSYQFGHDNVVDGEVPEFVEPQEIVSMNIGAMNTVHGEGINIGKKNTTDTFGITIGQRNVSHGAGIAIGEDLTVDNGSFGIGKRNVSHGAGIAIGEDLTVDNGSFGIGKRMHLESGSYAIGSNGNNFRVGNGSHLFGSDNSGQLDNGSYLFGGFNTLQPTSGSIIVGQSNTLTKSSDALTMFGLYNRAGDGDTPNNTVAIGNYNDIKGVSTAAFGIGAGSKNCSIAISAKGTNSQLGSFADTGSIAIGNRGVYAYDGSTSIGTDGVASHYHGISIGHGGVHAYNYSFAFGKSVTAHSFSMALGMDGCYAFEQSISVGRSGSVSLDRSMTFGRDGVFAWQRGIAIGEAGVQAISNAVALGLENVKGSSSSVSVGRAGVYTYNASVALGNGGYAVDGSMSLLNVPNQSSFRYKYDGTNDYIQNYALFWFSGMDGREGYVDVKLTGISKNNNGYVVNGTTYSRLKDVPFRDLTVYIRGYVDGQGNIVPYYTSKDMLEPPSSEDSWVLVNWGDGWRHDDTVSVISSFSETEIGFGASGGSLVVGNTTACATNGSVAISLRNPGTEPSFSLGLEQLSNNTITISPRTGVYSNNQFAPISLAEASSSRNSLAIGTGSKADNGSTSIGVNSFADRGSMAIGYGLWSTTNGFGKAIDDSLIISTVGYPSSGVRTRGESFCNSIAIGSGPYSSNSSQSIGVCTKAESKSVSIGYYSRSSNESIAIGDDNETGLNAFAIGTKNLSYGWSMLFGVDNKAPRERGAHATLIGYNNTSTSNIEKLEKEYDVWTSEPYVITDADRSTMDGYANTISGIAGQYLGSSAGTTLSNYLSAYKSYYYGNGSAPAYTSEIETIFNSLITNPVFIMTEEDKTAYLDTYYREDPTYTYSWEFLKAAYLDLFAIIKKYDSSATSVYNALGTVSSESDLWGVYYNYPLYNYVNTFYQCATFEGTPTYSAITDASDQAAYNSASMSFSSYGSMLLSKINNPTGHYETVTEDIICNTVVFGEGNTSNHYNSILIGSENISRAPLEEVANTDDDGFVVALGRKNEVLRNYDIAIGCKSKALGGENVAIQHSTAGDGNASYHNLAMFDSTALGTGNTAIQQSFVDGGYNNIAALQSHVNGGTYNLALFGSQVAGDQNIALMGSKITASTNTEKGVDPFPAAHQNCLFDSTLNQGDLPTDAPWVNYEIWKKSSESNIIIDTDINIAAQSFSRNLVIGRNKSEYHDATVNWKVLNFVDNIITGMNQDSPTLELNYIQNMTHNIWLNCKYDLTGIQVLNNNFAFASELKQVGTPSGSSAYPNMNTKYHGNFIFRSKTEGTGAQINDNVLFYDSVLSTATPNVGDHATLAGNFLMHSKLSYNSRDVDKVPIFNFQYNSDFVNTQQSFSFSTNTGPRMEDYKANSDGSGNLLYCNQSWNFGGNHLDFCTQSLMVGAESVMSNGNRCYMFGARNNMFMPATDADGWHALHNDLIVGEANKLLYDFNTVSDASNRLYGTVNTLSVHTGGFAFNNLIDGTDNTIEIFNAQVGANTIRGELNRMFLTFNEASSSGDRDVNKQNVMLGSYNLIAADSRIGCVVLTENQVANGIIVDCPKFVPATAFSWYVYQGPTMSISNNGYYLYLRRLGTIVSTRLPSGATIVAALVPGDLVDGVNNGTLVDNGYYKATGDLANIELPNIIYEELEADYLYSLQNGVAYRGEKSNPHESTHPAHLVDHNLLVGSYNLVHSNTVYYTLLGCFNEVRCTDIPYPSFAYGHGLVCGNNNQVENGSNILCFGNGNYSTGFNSVAIGMNLKSNKWQTVIGKYNVPIEGPNRLDIENPQDPNAALFIIGNGFSEKDDDDWQDEQYITRSNAMVVYADGTVRAKKFVSDEPELELINGTGIEMTDDITAGTRTISVSQELQDLLTFLSSRPATGYYTINSRDGVLTWEPIGITQV